MSIFNKKHVWSFSKNKDGSVAIETALVMAFFMTPIMLFTFDMGVVINTNQNLTTSSRSGMQYLLSGERSEENLKNIIVDSANGRVNAANISISTYCSCPNSGALMTPLDNLTAEPSAPYSTRSVNLSTIEQCNLPCGNKIKEGAIVSVKITDEYVGLFRSYPLARKFSVKIQ